MLTLAYVVVLAAVMAAFAALSRRVRRRGLAGLMSVADELWHPTGHRAHREIQEQVTRTAPRPSPEDDPPAGPEGPAREA